MKKATKISPRKRPATQADIIKAKNAATEQAASTAQAIFLTVLLDKEHATKEIVQRVWAEVNELSDSITQGYVTVKDLKKVLADEYDIVI